MKKARLTAWILAVVLCAGTALSGCGSAEETADEEVIEIEAAEEEEPEEPEPEEEIELVDIREIGDPADSIEIMLTNEMGEEITGLSIKSPLEKKYPDNIMTPDQEIEDKETVRLFYEPVTEEDIEPSDEDAILPDESYVGYWNESDDVDADGWELTIFDASDESVTFHLFGYRAASSDDYVVATFDDQNVGHFSTYLNGDKQTSGTITFYKDSVVVVFEQSDFQMTIPCTFVFDETHDVSREEGNNSPMEKWEARKASEVDSAQVNEGSDEDSGQIHELEQISADEDTCTLQVTLKNGDIYELVDFDVEDMAEVTLYLEDGVAYIEYMSLSQNVLISTKEKEKQIKADKEAAQVVIDMITAIGTVTEKNAEEHRAEIEAARKAYDALTDAQKAYVTNYQLLVEMEKMLGIQTDDGTRDEEAYQAGYYCGDNGYTMEDAEARAAELGYKSGTRSYQDFWDGYNDGLYGPYHTDGDNYAIGYRMGLNGLSEEEAQIEFGVDADPKSQYTKDFWNGYYAGYNDYNNANYEKDYVKDYDYDDDNDIDSDNDSDSDDEASYDSGRDNYAWGYSLGSAGVDSSVAQSEALNGGLVQNTQGYYDFQNGYDDGARDYWNNYYESEGIEVPGG